ncbi:hypothetical protein ORD22_06295 [Sporosarcina sp. GW1-11]|uniref:hypothetical protein n=1 Tax=Sporosarcina sp. GW1-11 TaxID=2899126 RepID=UPI00294F2D24|nr:hypothetical protein [Sporosarcina sp. GW1-11]MDV6377871.1 hypothetical protein [Sporosarcina sp. GW1-11]
MKWVGIVIVIAAMFIFVNKSYYPSLPIDNITAKDVIGKLKNSDEKIVELATDNDSTWYITKSKNEGISIADENVKKMIASKGWEYKAKEGSGLFFEKVDEQLIVTTQMWTKKYVLVQVQNKFKER